MTPNTPAWRPDVEGIRQRAKQRLNDGVCFTTLEEEQERNNLELIAHIEALEAVVKAAWAVDRMEDLSASRLRKALTALGDGDE